MYGVGNLGEVGGMRISAAANFAPAGGLGGVIETEAIMGEVAFGGPGILCTVNVDASSWSV